MFSGLFKDNQQTEQSKSNNEEVKGLINKKNGEDDEEGDDQEYDNEEEYDQEEDEQTEQSQEENGLLQKGNKVVNFIEG